MTRHGLKEQYAKAPCCWPRETHVASSVDQAECGGINADQACQPAGRGLKIQQFWRNMSHPTVCPRAADQTEIVKSP
jgi:hypothetical protein